MNAALSVPSLESGVVRIFALNMPPEQARFLQQENTAVADVLGVSQIDPDYTEVFALSDLEELGLDGYLVEGCGIPAETIAADQHRLKTLSGWVLVVFSRAFGGEETNLTPAKGVELVSTYSETQTDWTSAAPIETQSALPGTGAARMPPRQARATARRIGGTIFAVFMVIIALIFVTVLF